MYRKDQIKGIVAIILFALIGITYWLTENDDVVVTVSIIALLIWLLSMYFLNRHT